MGHSVLSVENKGQAESRAALWSNTQQSFAFSPFLQRSAIVHSFTEKKKTKQTTMVHTEFCRGFTVVGLFSLDSGVGLGHCKYSAI